MRGLARSTKWGLVLSALAVVVHSASIPEFWITLANYIGLNSLVAAGLVLLTGVTGMTSFGQAAFVGLGAYASAYLSTAYGLSPWIGLFVGIAITVAAACALGWMTLGLSGHFLPLCTIAWGISLFYLFGNMELLGKFDGLTSIAPIRVFGTDLVSGRDSFVLIWICVIWSTVALAHLLQSRTGRVLRALKSGVLMAESCGVKTMQYKMLAFVLAAVLAALSGWLYAHLQRAVNPTPFNLSAGISYLMMAVVGGVGSLSGAVLGAFLMTVLNNWLQNVLPSLVGQTGNYEAIVSGLLLIVLLQKSPQGVWPWLLKGAQALFARLNAFTLFRKNILRPAPLAPLFPATSPDIKGLLERKSRSSAASASNETLLRVKDVYKSFGGLVAVNGVSFDLQAGRIMGLIGPNGAGKSTLFNLISGILPLGGGGIEFLGREIRTLPARERAALGIARSFQHVHLIGQMSALDNVLIGAHLRARSSWLGAVFRTNQAEEQALRSYGMRCLARVGLEGCASLTAASLSLGQQRLLEIARALAMDPVLLLLDEPAAGLRHFEKLALQANLRSICRSDDLSILIVEHDMDFVMGLVDELLVMNFGTPIAQGSVQAVRENPAVIEAYLGGIE